jgi:hypothetical protein
MDDIDMDDIEYMEELMDDIDDDDIEHIEYIEKSLDDISFASIIISNY